jgi:hydrogenase expression/formation protein HypE
MAHGGGGRMMKALIERLFLPEFNAIGAKGKPASGSQPTLGPPHDSAVLHTDAIPSSAGRLAFTTDTFVVSPLTFPGGDIGCLAVYGTVNDLAMAGARPLALSTGFILEEGLPMEVLQGVVASMRRAAEEVGVPIVTGDTKVVDRGKGDGIFINTAGIGLVPQGVDISPTRVQPGDAVIVSGDLGRHGITIMSVREGLGFESDLKSDCGSLVGLVSALLEADRDVHCLRDLTRGGLASALCEIAGDAKVGIRLEEASIPVIDPVAGACELLGLDPLYVANEGRLVAFVPAQAAEQTLEIFRQYFEEFGPSDCQPAIIGSVVEEHPGTVELRNPLGSGRIVDMLSGEQMPRIC